MEARGIKTVLAQVNSKGQKLIDPQMAVREGDNILEIFLYDLIQPDEEHWLTGETIEHSSADSFQRVLSEHPDVGEIRLYVNSQGGYVREAMGIRAHLLRHKAHKVAYVDGWAASAASFVLTACDEIKMLSGSMQMLHSMWTFVIGNATELRKAADDLDQMMRSNREVYLEKGDGKLTEEKLLQIMDEERWLTAAECVELGLADQILTAAEYTTEAPEQQQQGAQIHQRKLDEPGHQDQIEKPEPEADPEPVQEESTSTFMAAILKAVERTYKNE